MNKKLCATILASTMILGSSMSAFAAVTSDGMNLLTSGTEISAEVISESEIASGGNGVDTDVNVTKGKVNIDIPKTMTIILNPFNVEDAGQVVSPVAKIKNYSNVDLDVRVADFKVNINGITSGTDLDGNPVQPQLVAAPSDATEAVDPADPATDANKAVFLMIAETTSGQAGTVFENEATLVSDGRLGFISPETILSDAGVPEDRANSYRSADFNGANGLDVVSGTDLATALAQPFATLKKSSGTTSAELTSDGFVASAGVLYFRYDGTASYSTQWKNTDTMKLEPVFKISPTVVLPVEP